MKINSLLNPFCDEPQGHHGTESPARASVPYSGALMTLSRRQKIPKDAPVFSEGNKIVGFVNYPPHEAEGDQDLTNQHRRCHIYPLGEILRKGVRHIPYNSDKKDFLDKTGRDAFESKYLVKSENRGLIENSVPVHLQATWRGEGVRSCMGLQRRVGPHDALLQVMQVLQGQYPSRPLRSALTDCYRPYRPKHCGRIQG